MACRDNSIDLLLEERIELTLVAYWMNIVVKLLRVKHQLKQIYSGQVHHYFNSSLSACIVSSESLAISFIS